MPQPKFDTSMLDELVAAFAAKDLVGLARMERMARGISAAEPLDGYMLLGACAAAKGDAEAATLNHEASIHVSPMRLDAWCNYLVSLMILGDSARVRDLAFKIGARFPANPHAHAAAMNALIELGLLQSATRFAAKFCSERVDNDEANCVDAVLSARGFTEDDLSAAVVCARRFLADNGVVRPRFSCEYIEDDEGGPGELAYGFHVKADATAAHLLERALFEHLANARVAAEDAGAVTFFIEVLPEERTHADSPR
ncbi:hypothetical protein LK996_02285 [Lysobacter sp. A6]|uniref:Uncharacterized protein n=1 Tax=Noviluteimonas lactosilytica TaxID=2888523 RepID=A0ABS8JEC4_9GAMM|nr:hypothetical protein [Lysobacter lactosilyticus]MCC8361913.1 hypothetical protein [Lysobacter lactosilyticus]